MNWAQQAWETIADLHKTLPADLPIKDRRRVLREAYPWGVRANWPYMAWLAAQNAYLRKYEKPGSRKGYPLTPLEAAINRKKATDAGSQS
ncbi:MAG: hypothetical protein JXQ84_07780 [Rhodospirillaceae bacterium]|nr:hypothetical protein [Rhodospirillaceae bacterium]